MARQPLPAGLFGAYNSHMRVIAGSAKSIPLKAIDGDATRPVLDRVKESLFSLLFAQGRIEDAVVLDLYAGSGSLGIEALSRGAKRAIFVERAKDSTKMLRDNLKRTHLDDRASIVSTEVRTALANGIPERESFDLIFFDPPFVDTEKEVDEDLAKGAASRLAPNGLLMVRHDSKFPQPPEFGPLVQTGARTWGRNTITFYEHPAETTA